MATFNNTFSVATVLGCLLNDTSLIKDIDLNPNDFVNRPHKILFSAIQNLSLLTDKTNLDVIDIDAYLSSTPTQYMVFEENRLADYIKAIKEKAHKDNFTYCYNTIKKLSLIRELQENGIDTSDIYAETKIATDYEKKMEAFNLMSVLDIVNHYSSKFIDLKLKWANTSGGAYTIDVAQSVDNYLDMLNYTPELGSNLKSGLLTALTRGNRRKNIYLFSGASGSGKTRILVSEAVNQASDEIYDLEKKCWVKNGICEPTLYISTELEDYEIISMCIAFLTGIDEEKIKLRNLTEEEKERIEYAKGIMKRIPLFMEYIADFDVEDIVNIMETNIIRHKITHCYLDYIQLTAKSYAYAKKHYGVTREDLIYVYFASEIKEKINKLDVFFCSATQLNRSVKEAKEKGEIDAGCIRGSFALADKISLGAIRVPVDSKLLEEVEPILKKGLYKTPTMATYCYKNRGGRLKRVIVWTDFDLGTMREYDCFVTDYEYNPIKLDPMVIEFGETPVANIIKEDKEVVNPLLVDWSNDIPEVASVGFGVRNMPDVEEEYEEDTLANCSF